MAGLVMADSLCPQTPQMCGDSPEANLSRESSDLILVRYLVKCRERNAVNVSEGQTKKMTI